MRETRNESVSKDKNLAQDQLSNAPKIFDINHEVRYRKGTDSLTSFKIQIPDKGNVLEVELQKAAEAAAKTTEKGQIQQNEQCNKKLNKYSDFIKALPVLPLQSKVSSKQAMRNEDYLIKCRQLNIPEQQNSAKRNSAQEQGKVKENEGDQIKNDYKNYKMMMDQQRYSLQQNNQNATTKPNVLSPKTFTPKTSVAPTARTLTQQEPINVWMQTQSDVGEKNRCSEDSFLKRLYEQRERWKSINKKFFLRAQDSLNAAVQTADQISVQECLMTNAKFKPFHIGLDNNIPSSKIKNLNVQNLQGKQFMQNSENQFNRPNSCHNQKTIVWQDQQKHLLPNLNSKKMQHPHSVLPGNSAALFQSLHQLGQKKQTNSLEYTQHKFPYRTSSIQPHVNQMYSCRGANQSKNQEKLSNEEKEQLISKLMKEFKQLMERKQELSCLFSAEPSNITDGSESHSLADYLEEIRQLENLKFQQIRQNKTQLPSKNNIDNNKNKELDEKNQLQVNGPKSLLKKKSKVEVVVNFCCHGMKCPKLSENCNSWNEGDLSIKTVAEIDEKGVQQNKKQAQAAVSQISKPVQQQDKEQKDTKQKKIKNLEQQYNIRCLAQLQNATLPITSTEYSNVDSENSDSYTDISESTVLTQ